MGCMSHKVRSRPRNVRDRTSLLLVALAGLLLCALVSAHLASF